MGEITGINNGVTMFVFRGSFAVVILNYYDMLLVFVLLCRYMYVHRSSVYDIAALLDGQEIRHGSGAGPLCSLLFSPIHLCWKVRDIKLHT